MALNKKKKTEEEKEELQIFIDYVKFLRFFFLASSNDYINTINPFYADEN